MFKLVFLVILWLFLVAVITVAALGYFRRRAELEHEETMFFLKKRD
jgi:cytochrome b561